MRYLIHGFEDIYQGLHGIEDWYVTDDDDTTECGKYSLDTLYDMGADLSRDVIEDYMYYIELGQRAEEEDADIDELIEEDIAFEIFEITNDDKSKTSIDLVDEVFRDPAGFLIKYACEQI